MPVNKSLTIPVNQVRKGDYVERDGGLTTGVIATIERKTKYTYLTLEGGAHPTTIRFLPAEEIEVRRDVPTDDEVRQTRLDRIISRAIASRDGAKAELASVIAKITEGLAEDATYVLKWRADDAIRAEATVRIWDRVHRAVDVIADEFPAAPAYEVSVRAIAAVAGEIEQDLIRYQPARSTSPMSNLVDDEGRIAASRWLQDWVVMDARGFVAQYLGGTE